jgi:hypothetical protein
LRAATIQQQQQQQQQQQHEAWYRPRKGKIGKQENRTKMAHVL